MKKRFCRWQRILDSWTLHCLQHRTGRAFSYYCRPEFLDEKKAGCRIDVEELYHPLLTHPVANSLYAEGGILLTGSNASGKSTFMKNMAVNAILVQALNTSLSKRYRGVVCRIMTSMALRDNLAQGESYFCCGSKIF